MELYVHADETGIISRSLASSRHFAATSQLVVGSFSISVSG